MNAVRNQSSILFLVALCVPLGLAAGFAARVMMGLEPFVRWFIFGWFVFAGSAAGCFLTRP